MDCDARHYAATFQALSASDDRFFDHLEADCRVPLHLIVETRDWAAAADFNLEDWL